MLPCPDAPLLRGQFAKKWVGPVDNVFFFEIMDHVKQSLFLFFKILLRARHDKGRVGRQIAFEGFVSVKD